MQRCKILAGGELTKRHLTVEADAISLQAVKMVLLMEGKVVRRVVDREQQVHRRLLQHHTPAVSEHTP